MPVLLLARGDHESKTLLRRAIEARYGLGPPAIETLRLELKGRIRAKFGPVVTWMPIDGIAYFKFPLSVRWDFAIRPAGVALNSGAEAFDGTACRRKDNRAQITIIEDAEPLASARARLWTIAAILLMPLTEYFVELSMVDEHTLDAAHTEAGVRSRIHLHNDHTLDFTATDCLNPTNGKQQTYTIRLSEGQTVVGDLMLPGRVSTYWDDQPELELSPIASANNPSVDDSLFRLENSAE